MLGLGIQIISFVITRKVYNHRHETVIMQAVLSITAIILNA